ncbi:hypothetical protein ACQ4PT_030141 [Festuca glaucescens]
MLPRYRGTLLADLTSGPSCAGKILNSSSLREKINDSSTMLLYETPSGFAIISFGGVDLSIPLENVRIEEYKKFEEKSTAINLANEVIGSELAEMLSPGSKVGKEAITDFDSVLNSATGDNGSGVTVRRSSELDLSGKPRQIVTCDKQAADTDAKQAGAARSMDETEDKNLTGGTHGLVGDKQDGVIPAIIPRFGPIQNEERITPKFVERLRDIQGKHDELEKKFFEERGSLEAKYQKLYEPLYSKRLKILTGVGEVQGITQSCDGTPAKQEEGKGVPDFWLNAMIINEILGEEIQERDEEALKYLKDIKWCRIVDPKGFKLEFFFDTNPFFKNSVLAKTYHIDEEDEPILEKAIGTEIDWCRGKCLTQNVLKKKPKKGSKNTKPITIVEDCESFFKFFSPTEVPNDDKEIDDS